VANTNVVKETSKLSLNNGVVNKPVGKPTEIGVKIETKSLSLKEELKCRKEEIFRTFLEPELVSAFTRGKATVDGRVGGKFVMFDGNITGEFTAIERDVEIKQKWRFRSWPEEHYSEVIIKFDEKEDHTNLSVTQTGIPASDFERTENGWKQFYFHSIKQTFGYGALLY